jgi:ABC-type ATPase with predicted acetyltransferase domain
MNAAKRRVVFDSPDVLIERRTAPSPHRMSLLPDIFVERGTMRDWELLHELHYKAESLGFGPRIFRCVLRDKTIGVGVMTVTKMLLAGRNQLFERWLRPNAGQKDTRLVNRARACWINAHMCMCSRLVLDTVYRGTGVAYRMQNLMMRLSGKRFIEFQSAMSKFNPFAAKAGVRFVDPARSSHYQRGLEWFRRWFESMPTDSVSIMNELDAMPSAARQKCVNEMRQLYFRCSSLEKCGNNRANGFTRVEGMAVGRLLKNLQQVVFATPLYGVYQNPDYDVAADKPRALPERLPLLAFDNQPVTAPLDLERLRAL